MGLPLLVLAVIMGVITAPGLIAQHLAAKRGKAEAPGLLEMDKEIATNA